MNITKYKITIGAAALCLVLAFAIFGQAQTEVQKLPFDQVIERELVGGQKHKYKIEIKANDFLQVKIEQKGIDVAVKLFDKNGKQLTEMDSPNRNSGFEILTFIVADDGVYIVEVKSLEANAAKGNYTIFLETPHTATEKDRKRIQARDVFTEARKLYGEGTSESKRAALLKFDEARRLFQETGNKQAEARTLEYIGRMYDSLGEKQKALEFFNLALPLQRAVGDKFGEGNTLAGIGRVYDSLGDKHKASEFFNQSLPLLKSAQDESEDSATRTLSDRLSVFLNLLLKDKSIRDKRGETVTPVACGTDYKNSNLDEKQKELKWLNSLLSSQSKARKIELNALLLTGIGEIHYSLNENQKALEFLNLALPLAKASGNKSREAQTLDCLQHTWFSLGNSRLAIFYGKQSVNKYQELRQAIQGLEKETQKTYLKMVEGSYRKLAGMLISEGHLLEAQTVLDLLKEDEFKDITVRRSGEIPDTVPYSKAETDVIAKIENLVALERERAELQKLKTLSKEQEAKLEQLRLDIAAANKAFDVALDALGKTEASTSTRVDEIKGGQEIQSALTALGKETKSGVVALYTVLGADEEKDETGKTKNVKSKFGWVIMVTEKGYKAYPIDVTNLEETVFAFRNALSSDKYDPQPLAEKIYTAIFRQTSAKQKRTLESDLREYLGSHKDKTLMWSLDGVLRYIPMAALHDGKGYLVENYRSAVFTKQSFLWLTRENQTGWNALGLGVSEKRENFDALPGVKTELEQIVREPNKPTGIMNGSIKLNENFKEQMFFNTVGAGAFPVVHIASHYSFNPSQQDASFLLVGDGRLTFSEMKAEKNLFGAVDLLTLSACDTGISGNGKEAEGFAYLAQSLGAKSVIASLWKVSDAGTPELMIRFYKLRTENPNISKGEAFRQAQLSLLNTETGKAKTSDARRSEIVTLGGKKGELPLYEKTGKPPFAHPHYWSSFILIGNWR